MLPEAATCSHILMMPQLKLLGQENNGEPHLGMLRPLEQLLEYKRIKPDEIPNFLMPEYKINS